MTTEVYDVIGIGAGPTGLACAIEAKRAGLRPLVIDKGCLCNSLFHYPVNMLFFTTPERMEIGDLPMTTAGGKPTRAEALKYYRRAVEHYGIETKLYEKVDRTEGSDGEFEVHARDASGSRKEYRARKIIIATGYYDLPNHLGIPGEDLSHVSHYFSEPHPYWDQDVVVIGGKNSAAEAALDLFRAGAKVTTHSSRRRVAQKPEILGEAGHREPHQRRRNQGVVLDARHAYRAATSMGKEFNERGKSRPCDASLRDDRIPPGFRVSRTAGNFSRSRDSQA